MAEVMNLHSAPGQTAHNADLRAEMTPKPVLPGVEGGMRPLAGRGSGPARPLALDAELGIPHGKVALHDFLGDLAARIGRWDGEQSPCMTGRERTFGDELAKVLLESQESHGVGHRRAALTHPLRNFFL